MTETNNPSKQHTYIIEHLDPELEAWSTLEYKSIAQESSSAGSKFLLTSVPSSFKVPAELENAQGFAIEHRSVEELYPGAEGKKQVCLLDPKAEKELNPLDGEQFSVFLFGGILGDDPPRDRTAELRVKGFAGRRLGPVQMSTDTAVRVTRIVVQDGVELEKIPYVDSPELRVSKHESTELPFRYVKGKDGEPIMPEGMLELIKRDPEKGFGDML